MNRRAWTTVVRLTSIAVPIVGAVLATVGPGRVATVSSPPVDAGGIAAIQSTTLRDTTPDDLIARAVERAPFTSIERVQTDPPAPQPQAIVIDEPLRVLGTVVDSLGGSFALCQLGAAQAVILRVGQRVGSYELRSIGKGRALFVNSDGESVERRVPRAGS